MVWSPYWGLKGLVALLLAWDGHPLKRASVYEGVWDLRAGYASQGS